MFTLRASALEVETCSTLGAAQRGLKRFMSFCHHTKQQLYFWPIFDPREVFILLPHIVSTRNRLAQHKFLTINKRC